MCSQSACVQTGTSRSPKLCGSVDTQDVDASNTYEIASVRNAACPLPQFVLLGQIFGAEQFDAVLDHRLIVIRGNAGGQPVGIITCIIALDCSVCTVVYQLVCTVVCEVGSHPRESSTRLFPFLPIQYSFIIIGAFLPFILVPR